ncbi:MAG: transposase family protein [Bacteroidota bacterium]
MSNLKKEIVYLSEPYQGAVHDFAILKTEFPPEEPLWFDEKGLYVDLGFVGIDKEYEIPLLNIPFKKPRRKSKKDPGIPFTREQKDHNKSVSQIRIGVEHAIGGLKRYRFLSDRLRCKDIHFYSQVAGVAAGLWNFQLSS